MTVWVVQYYGDGDYKYLLGVYKTEQAALNAAHEDVLPEQEVMATVRDVCKLSGKHYFELRLDDGNYYSGEEMELKE